jgi:transcription elongation factor Elf1
MRTVDFKDQKQLNRQEIRTVSVVLRKQSLPISAFRCFSCGSILFEYFKDVQLLFEGEIQDSEKEARILCKRCNIYFIIENAKV